MKVRASRSGLHGYDRATGMNVLLDERDVPRELWSRAPRYVSIALTNACDLACPYCYAPKHAARLPFDAVVRWSVELSAAGCLGIGFGGGEPLLYPRFAQLCREITSATDLGVSFTTHGHWITPQIASKLRGAVHFVRVSVDGYGETYERLRGRPFSALRSRLVDIAEMAPFGVNYVVNEDTVDDLDAVAAWATEAGAVEILLLPEVAVHGRPGAGVESLTRLDAWIAANSERYRLSISEGATEFLTSPILDTFGREDPAERYAHIDATGRLKASSFSRDGVQVTADGGVLAALELMAAPRRGQSTGEGS